MPFIQEIHDIFHIRQHWVDIALSKAQVNKCCIKLEDSLRVTISTAELQ